MKTLASARDREEIRQRLAALRPDSTRLWGTMSPNQMVCHLADSFRGVMGQKRLSLAPKMFGRKVVKWIALYAPMKWPHGLATRPEMDQFQGGTPAVAFESDVSELHKLMDQFTAVPRTFEWIPHPFFLEMSDRDWMRWGYLHMDHHFRQFGV
jgi:hypothetical protein